MTQEQFLNIFSKLAGAYPEYYRKTRAETMAKTLAYMSVDWFAEKAQQVISSGEPKFNWGGEVALFIKNQAQERASKKFWEEREESLKNCTDAGLPNYLSSLGASSLLEAIEKTKQRGA